MFSAKIIIATLLFFGAASQAQTLEFDNGPTSKITNLEYPNGPTSVIDAESIKELKDYAVDVNISITRLLSKIKHMESNEENSSDSIVNMKTILLNGVNDIIRESKDKRSLLLLTHSLQAGSILVRLIEQEAIQTGQAAPGIVGKQFYILKQSLQFASEYFVSDFEFIDGVLRRHEAVSNPKFIEYGVRLNQFILEMSKGITHVRSTYGMIRWSLAVLANYIQRDSIGVAYANTQANIAFTLLEKNTDGSSRYPDLVNGEAGPIDLDCIKKIRELKLLAKTSMDEIQAATAAMIRN